MKRQELLMAVYNPIEMDGRVKRAAAALAAEYRVTLFCPAGPGQYRSDLYEIRRIRKPAGFGRISVLLYFWWKLLLLTLRLRPAIVYAHDFFLPFPGWICSRLVGATFVYDAHELFLPEGGERLSLRSWFFYRLERAVIGRADLVIAANAERAGVMQAHFRLPQRPTPIGNIPPMPVSLLAPAELATLYPALSRTGPLSVHVLYMGDVAFERGLPVLIDSIRHLPEHFKLVFIGAGPDLPALHVLAEEASPDRIRVIGPVPHEHIHDVTRTCDIGFVSYSPRGLNNILCAPNKVFEYAQAGLPMVATCQPPIARMFSEHRIGELVGCNALVRPQEIASALSKIAQRLKKYQAALVAFLEAYTWQNEADRLAAKLRSVVEK